MSAMTYNVLQLFHTLIYMCLSVYVYVFELVSVLLAEVVMNWCDDVDVDDDIVACQVSMTVTMMLTMTLSLAAYPVPEFV